MLTVARSLIQVEKECWYEFSSKEYEKHLTGHAKLSLEIPTPVLCSEWFQILILKVNFGIHSYSDRFRKKIKKTVQNFNWKQA